MATESPLKSVYRVRPRPLQRRVASFYDYVHPAKPRRYLTDWQFERARSRLRTEYAERFFEPGNFEDYMAEFEEGPAASLYHEGLERHRQVVESGQFSSVGLAVGKLYYAWVREYQPDVLIETGVCNGLSTLCLLLALHENDNGHLYSIDLPLRADDPLDEFRAETYSDTGASMIPSDKDPGWIIPDELRSRWDLVIGKSQRKLPELLLDRDEIDFFVHDSEHSHPCMVFEYELAFEWLDSDGIIFSDDIMWNDAFETFSAERDANTGRIHPNVGYIRKGGRR